MVVLLTEGTEGMGARPVALGRVAVIIANRPGRLLPWHATNQHLVQPHKLTTNCAKQQRFSVAKSDSFGTRTVFSCGANLILFNS